MKTTPLETTDPSVHLIEPNVERDAPLSVAWLEGDIGRNTLRLMGVTDDENKPSTLQGERERIEGFVTNPDQLNWAIQYNDRVVGAIWVDLVEKESVPAPAIHIMIGDPEARGKGIGSSSTKAVIGYLRDSGELQLFSRHLADNTTAAKLLAEQGFTPVGEPKPDKDGLIWQNVQLDLE